MNLSFILLFHLTKVYLKVLFSYLGGHVAVNIAVFSVCKLFACFKGRSMDLSFTINTMYTYKQNFTQEKYFTCPIRPKVSRHFQFLKFRQISRKLHDDLP